MSLCINCAQNQKLLSWGGWGEEWKRARKERCKHSEETDRWTNAWEEGGEVGGEEGEEGVERKEECSRWVGPGK